MKLTRNSDENIMEKFVESFKKQASSTLINGNNNQLSQQVLINAMAECIYEICKEQIKHAMLNYMKQVQNLNQNNNNH